MATETMLKELFEVSKRSILFKGMSSENIWKACLSHSHNSDDEVRKAIENIQNKDHEAELKALESQKNLEKGKIIIKELHEREIRERKADELNAEQILENLFE